MTANSPLALIAAFLFATSAFTGISQHAVAQSAVKASPADETWRTLLTPEDVNALPPLIERETQRLRKDYEVAQRMNSVAQLKSRIRTQILSIDRNIERRTRQLQRDPTMDRVRLGWRSEIALREARLAFKPLGGTARPPLVAVATATEAVAKRPPQQPTQRAPANPNNPTIANVKSAPKGDADWKTVLTPSEIATLPSLIEQHTRKLESDLKSAQSKGFAWDFKDSNQRRIAFNADFISQQANSVRDQPNNSQLRKDLLELVAEREARMKIAARLP